MKCQLAFWFFFAGTVCSSLVWAQSVPDPDIPRSTCEIVQARGFSCEVHYATTYQGYIIQLHRVVSPDPDPEKLPVILQTGLIGTSADFVMASANASTDPTAEVGPNLGLELSKKGYDVWLSNNRGSVYALNHTTLTPLLPAFWDFSFDEIAKYDTPAIVDYVLNSTDAKKVHYIGHSQGTSVMFALLSQTTAYNDKVQSFIAISPIAQIGAANTSFRAVTAAVTLLQLATLNLPKAVFAPATLTNLLTGYACSLPIVTDFCEGIFFSVTGPDDGEMDEDRLPVYLSHMPTSTSARNLVHFNQLFTTNQFKKYDFGLLGNLAKYGASSPPLYPLSSISMDNIAVIYGQNDWFVPSDSDTSGITPLEAQLPAGAGFLEIGDPLSNHVDPLLGINIAPAVNRKILQILNLFYPVSDDSANSTTTESSVTVD